jgi:hypothetical protein
LVHQGGGISLKRRKHLDQDITLLWISFKRPKEPVRSVIRAARSAAICAIPISINIEIAIQDQELISVTLCGIKITQIEKDTQSDPRLQIYWHKAEVNYLDQVIMMILTLSLRSDFQDIPVALTRGLLSEIRLIDR